jgi:hypothetical protein
MSAAAATRLTLIRGAPESTLAGPAHARDGTEVPVLPWPDQTPHDGDRQIATEWAVSWRTDRRSEYGSAVWLHNRTANVTFCG